MTLYVLFFSSFFAAMSCFLCKIDSKCPLFFWWICGNQDTCKTYVCLACWTSCSCSWIIVLSSNILPSTADLHYWKTKKKQRRHSDCGCLKILALIIRVLLSVMRMHPRYELCGSLHVTYLVLVRTLLTWSEYVPGSDACFHEYIPWFTPHFHLLYSSV